MARALEFNTIQITLHFHLKGAALQTKSEGWHVCAVGWGTWFPQGTSFRGERDAGVIGTPTPTAAAVKGQKDSKKNLYSLHSKEFAAERSVSTRHLGPHSLKSSSGAKCPK